MATTLQTGRNAQFPPCFFTDQQNHLYVVDGINKGKRWDGYSSSVVDLGIAAPTAAPTITTPVGGAATAGDYVLYYRFKDADGNYSSLSPVATVTAASNDQFSWDTVPASSNSRVTHKELLRSLSGQSATVYLVTTITNATTSYTSDTSSDATLAANTAVPILNGDGSENANRFDPPPTTCFALSFYDRFYYFGLCSYKIGSVEVTNGSATVQGRGTAWTDQMAAWKFYVPGETTEYTVSTVNTSSQQLTLSVVFGGSTNLFSAYCLKPAKTLRRRIWYTSVLEPESVRDADYILPAEEGDEYSGGYSLRNDMFICEPKRTWRIFVTAMTARASVQNKPGIGMQHAISRGLFNNRCWAKIDDRVYCMDDEGVYIFEGQAEKHISDAVQDYWSDGLINFAAKDWFFVSLDTQAEVVRFHVAIGTHYLPQHALVWDYRSEIWYGLEEFPWRFGHWCMSDVDGWPTAIYGSEYGAFYLQEGTLDGPTERTIRGTATAATALTLVDDSSDAVLPSAGVVNAPLSLVAGRGEGQVRRIVASSSGTLTIDYPWAIIPDTTTEYQVGGVPWLWKSPIWQFPDTPQDSRYTREFSLTCEPTVNDASSIRMRRYFDHATVAENFAADQDLGNGVTTERDAPDIVMVTKRKQAGTGIYSNKQATFTGRRHFRVDGYLGDRRDNGRYVQLELRGVQGMDQVRLYGLELKGVQQRGQ